MAQAQKNRFVGAFSTRKQLLDITEREAAAREGGIISKDLLDRYKALFHKDGKMLDYALMPRREKKAKHKEFREFFGGITDKEQEQIAQYLGLEDITEHALDNLDFAQNTPDAYSLFRIMLEDGIAGKSSDEALEFLAEKKKNLDEMVIRMVLTMHPTIFDSDFAIQKKTVLTSTLVAFNPENGREIRVKEKSALENFIRGVVGDIKGGKYTTPEEKVNVAYEASMEKNHTTRIRKQISSAMTSLYTAVADLAEKTDDHKVKRGLLDFITTDKQYNKSHIFKRKREDLISEAAEKDAKRIFMLATWGLSADTDGRTEATSIEAYRQVEDQVVDGKFTGSIRDLRQNAKVQELLISSLVQARFRRNSKFRGVCEEFMAENIGNGKPRYEKYNMAPQGMRAAKFANQIILSSLDEEDRGKFLEKMIAENIPLLPDGLEESVISFNEQYRIIYKKFLNEHKLSPDTSFAQLMEKTDNRGFNLAKLLRDEVREAGFELDETGRSYQPIDPKTGLTEYLLGTKQLNGTKELEDIPENYSGHTTMNRKTLMDTVKRLIVFKHLKEKYPDDIVADRHQIANFSSTNDFLTMMKLFQDTKLMTVKDGKVEKVDIHVQPLLETIQDLRHAPDIFKELLKEGSISLSYYQKTGVAKFMLGFSDGAKSAGNFASEWEIYKAASELTKIFAEKGIRTEFFQGRGRGMNRGGNLEAGMASTAMMAANVVEKPYFDCTFQSDLPVQMGIFDGYGERQIASSMMGAWNGVDRAKKMAKMSGAERRHFDAMEADIDWISNLSAQKFNEVVREGAETVKFVNGVWKNPKNNSRPEKRGNEKKNGAEIDYVKEIKFFRRALKNESLSGADRGICEEMLKRHISDAKKQREESVKKYDDTRAVPIETAFAIADLPANLVGFKYAIKKFIENSGGSKAGMKRLRELTEKHPFFAAMVEKAKIGMEKYDPDIADIYGGVTKAQKCVDSIKHELKGLNELLHQISGESKVTRASIIPTPEDGKREKWRDIAGHTLHEAAKSPTVKDRATQVTYAEFSRLGLKRIPPKLQKTVWKHLPEELMERARSYNEERAQAASAGRR